MAQHAHRRVQSRASGVADRVVRSIPPPPSASSTGFTSHADPGEGRWLGILYVESTGAFRVSGYPGWIEVPVPIPGNPTLAGLAFYAQCAFVDACGPTGWSASNAVEVVLQP